MNFDTGWNIISERVNQLVSSEIIPGMAVGLYYQGKIYSMGAGYANYETQQQVKADTLFQIGSISKSYTATVIMKWVEEGKLDLDLPIMHYLPELNLADVRAAQQITLRHLLNHTSGLEGDRDQDYGNGNDALSKAIAEFYTLRQVTTPGSFWFYNNNGYSLAAYILEQVLQKPFETIMKETLFAPLDLQNSFFFAQDAITYSCAVGHLPLAENKFQVARPFSIPRWSNAAGGVIANVEDVIRFVRLHLEGGRVGDLALLSSKMVVGMQEISVDAFGMGDFWGLGWRIEEYQGGLVYGHGGTTHGFRSQLMFSPEHQFAIVVVNNGSHNAINKEIANLALAQYCGLTPKKHEPHPLEIADLDCFNGAYQMPGITAVIQRVEGNLILSFTPPIITPVTLIPISERKFIIDNGDYKNTLVDFVVAEDGEIIFLRFVAHLLKRQ